MSNKEPNPIDKHVGLRVRQRRLIIGMSQERLADAIGVTFQQVQKYEKGTNRVSASRMSQIARAIDVDIGFFYVGAPTATLAKGNGHHPEGAPSAPDAAALQEFLSTQDGIAINRLLPKVRDAKVRRSIVNLVAEIVAHQI